MPLNYLPTAWKDVPPYLVLLITSIEGSIPAVRGTQSSSGTPEGSDAYVRFTVFNVILLAQSALTCRHRRVVDNNHRQVRRKSERDPRKQEVALGIGTRSIKDVRRAGIDPWRGQAIQPSSAWQSCNGTSVGVDPWSRLPRHST